MDAQPHNSTSERPSTQRAQRRQRGSKQPTRTIDVRGIHEILEGDCLDVLARVPKRSCRLVFADPPFNIGYAYNGYEDDLRDRDYLEWSKRWMRAVSRVLTDDGSFYLAIGDDFAAQLKLLGEEIGLTLRNWIIWHYTFGQNMRTKFCRAHTHIFYFVRDPQRVVFNDRVLRYPSARHTEYQDARAHPLGRVPDDVWSDFPRVCGTFKERSGTHGCQMPEALLMRIIAASSDPGDLVIDPFSGSGTTAVAAQRLGRRFLAIDQSATYVAEGRARLARAVESDEADETDQVSGASRLAEDHLLQLFRETRVHVDRLLENPVALRVMAAAWSQRCDREFTPARLEEALRSLATAGLLPKLPNDRTLTGREPDTRNGTSYQRKVQRFRGRRKVDAES